MSTWQKSDLECTSKILLVKNALYVINGKWKLIISISISSDNRRFRKIVRRISKITSKVHAKELKDLEYNHLIKRTVYDGRPVVIKYQVTPYAKTLQPVIKALNDWKKSS
ncbi:winged helix-turn-helix transcriptional regulator [Thermoflavifilum thermophilum]|uniref:winged helix-turn-helix transcriptional regulator n=1 Tax=Thermoflavifilum thermophilum TaxID=1393122 RepID=UPI000B838599|nr:helix-turn-helix domain-containing protein [Thermoflavifilum thermophilum]